MNKRRPPAMPAVSTNTSIDTNLVQRPITQRASSGPKAGAQRTTKTAQKLKLLPEGEDIDEVVDDYELPDDAPVYSQIAQIPSGTARRDAIRLTKAMRLSLPRVTAYCTASSYKMDRLIKFLQSRRESHGVDIKQFDECVYTPYIFDHDKKRYAPQELLIEGVNPPETDGAVIDQNSIPSQLFIFEYGAVVMWSFASEDEKRFLKEIQPFEVEKLADEDVEIEEFHLYYADSYQPRIYNDVITLKNPQNYMIKLSVSHALAQSVKLSLYEELMDNTIEDTKDIPRTIADEGKVNMPRSLIMKQIGQLFILRININLVGSVLDSPELFWSEPHLEPIYTAARQYLEMNSRVELLNQRAEVIGELLSMLKESITHTHAENLEWIVIILIGVEIIVGLLNMAVDLLGIASR